MEDTIRVSHSKIAKWNRCSFAWHLSYVQKWAPKRKAYPLTLGSMVHEFLESYYKGVIEGEKDPLSRHRDKVQVRSQSVEDTDELQALSQAAKLVERYIPEFAFFEDNGFIPVEVEKHYEVEYVSPKGRPFIFELYFDVMLYHEQSGKFWIMDHKTHNSNNWSSTQVMMDPQQAAYILAMREKLGVDVFGAFYNMINTYDYKKPAPSEKLFSRHRSYRTPEELDAIHREIGLAVDDMIDNGNNPRRTITKDCSWCEFQNPCLMDMKGFDLQQIMSETYDEKKARPEREEEESIGNPYRL